MAAQFQEPPPRRARSLDLKVVNPNDFTDPDQIRDRVATFEIRYNAIAEPFSWKLTRTDLDDLLRRLDAHEGPSPTP